VRSKIKNNNKSRIQLFLTAREIRIQGKDRRENHIQ
jgi:hypothetical protein